MNIKNSILDLRFLGLGQRVKLQTDAGADVVEEVIKQMKDAFSTPGSDTNPLPTAVEFDPSHKWLIGIDLKLLEFLRLAAVFQDPSPYGLLIELDKTSGNNMAGDLAGLKFQVGYEKVSDSMGLYKGKVTLPAAMRELDFTTFKLTMPEIYLEIFSNGDFKIDVGFPYNLDFSRSLKVEAYPYLGAGGFYLGKYSPDTASHTRVPQGENFKSINEFGLGLQLGTGKEIDKGILKAGASLTFMGLLEGTMAVYGGDEHNNGVGDRFYWIKGVLGVGGKIYGSVDLQVVTAKVDAEVKATAEGIFEAYCPTLLRVKAEIHATGEVTVGYKKFSRKITKEFHDQLELDYTIPKKGNAHWSGGCKDRGLLLLPPTDPLPMVWKPMNISSKKELLLYVVPHKSLDIWETGEKSVQYTVMTYIDSPSQASKRASEQTGMEVFLEGLFLWMMHAYFQREPGDTSRTPDEIGMEQLSRLNLIEIHELLTSPPSDRAFITYDQMRAFLNNYYSIGLCDPEGMDSSDDELRHMSYFPMLPDLILEVNRDTQVAAPILSVNFSTEPKCNDVYRTLLKSRLRETMTRYQTEEEHAFDSKSYAKVPPLPPREPTMAELFFEDCTVGMIKELAKRSLDALDDQQLITVKQLWEILRGADVSGHIAALATGFIMVGLRVPCPENPTTICPIYEAAKQQFSVPEDIGESEGISITLKATGALPVDMVTCADGSLSDSELIITLPPDEIERAKALANLDIKPEDVSVQSTALKPYREMHPVFSGRDPILWNDKDQLWLLPETWRRKLESSSDRSGLVLKKAKKFGTECDLLSTDNYSLFTKLELDIKCKVEPVALADTVDGELADIYYEILGTDHQGKVLLEHLVQALKEHQVTIQSVNLLYTLPNNEGKLTSNPDATIDAVQTNLSTWTSPDAFLAEDQNLTMVEVLLASSLNRLGGNFLRYCTGNGDELGLPPHLFGAQGMGKITILIVYDGTTIPAPYMNGVFIGEQQKVDADEEWIYYEDERTTLKIPTIPPGHVGLQTVRKNPAVHYPTDSDMRYVMEQFQMMGFQYMNSTSFQDDEVLMPISPKNNSATTSCQLGAEPARENTLWWYDAVLPIDKNFIPGADPYRAVGSDLKLKLQLQDLFGNRLQQLSWTATLPIRYRDMIEPLHQWPGTKASYTLGITDSGTPCIHLALTFDKESYTDQQSEHAKLAVSLYGRIRHQLAHDIRVAIRSSLAVTDTNTEGELQELSVDGLDQYICRIRAYLGATETCSASPTENPEEPIEYRQCIPVEILNPYSIFELWIQVAIHRVRYVDPEVLGVDGVTWGLSDILPEALLGTIAGEGSQPRPAVDDLQQSIHDLDNQFQNLFRGSRLALGRSDRLPSTQRSIWVIKLDSKYTIEQQPYMFAKTLMSKTKTSYTFDLERFPDRKISAITFPGSMLQQWAKECLRAIQEMLSLPFLDMVQQVEGSLSSINEAKRKIAVAIAETLQHVGDVSEDDSQIAIAKERFKQQLLVNLSDAYEIDTVVQHRASTWGMNLPMNSAPPRLYVLMKPDQAERSTLSPAKLPFTNGDSTVTYLFTAKDDAMQEKVVYPGLNYEITHVEHQIHVIDGAKDKYEGSAWLSLIHPIQGRLSNEVEVPVISHTYPETPIILGHDYELHEPRADDLKKIRSWSYNVSYRSESPLQAQDRLYVRVNFGDSARGHALSSNEQLAKAMAQLLFAYYGMTGSDDPSIRKVLDQTAKDLKSTACFKLEDETAIQAVQTFCSLVTDLSNKWSIPAFTNDDGGGGGTSLRIQETSERGTNHLLYTITGGDNPVSVSVKGYKTEFVGAGSYKFYKSRDDGPNEYLAFDSPLKDRTLIFENLDKLNQPQAETTIYLKRNEITFNETYSPKYKAVKEAFILQSEYVKTPTPVTPLPVGTKRINIASLESTGAHAKKLLVEHLNTLLVKLLDGRDRTDHMVQLNTSFSFNLLTNMPRKWSVKVPQVETIPFQYENGAASLALLEEISAAIYSVYDQPDLPYHDFGVLRISLTLYDSKDLTVPILQLKELFLASDDIRVQRE